MGPVRYLGFLDSLRCFVSVTVRLLAPPWFLTSPDL
jgi:hypothetical protein